GQEAATQRAAAPDFFEERRARARALVVGKDVAPDQRGRERVRRIDVDGLEALARDDPRAMHVSVRRVGAIFVREVDAAVSGLAPRMLEGVIDLCWIDLDIPAVV